MRRNFQSYLRNRFGTPTANLSQQEQYFRDITQQEYDRRKQQLANATTVEEVEAVSVVF